MALGSRRPPDTGGLLLVSALLLSLVLLFPSAGAADEPYARSRNYDLQNVRVHLWFDLDQRRIRGEADEHIAALRDNVAELKFDSVGLTIQDLTVDGMPTKFSTTANNLIIPLTHPAQRGEQHDIVIHYEGQPKKGLYFILPDKNYPEQPREIWTQGESEDTRYYIPIYDYPNDRTTSEMLLTVPASWITISNGRLMGVKSEADGAKTWDWKQSEPLSTYLISVVAGDFVQKEDSWRGIPLRYVVPRGQEYKIDSSFDHTKQMLDLFSEKLDVPYPWDQYAQTFVDDFVEGGMENTSATTLTVRELENPALVAEDRTGSDYVESHELAHQWFGDLVTCKDWADLWLNEGFATYFEHFWNEQHYGADDSAYEFWREQAQWFRQKRLYSVPIVDRNSTDSEEYAGNIYTKGGWILKMLREQLGDADFFRALHYYLETNRGQNVVTADLQKSIEQATSTNVDKFFHQWVYRAGAPQFEVSYTYDDAAHQIKLVVNQTQKVEGLVGLFDVPIQVEIATPSGRKSYPIEVSEASQSFTFPADAAPSMVLFDKGDAILKTVEFKRSPVELIYQLKNAETVPDRADAAVALGGIKDNSEVVAALTDAAQYDSFWGIRAEALRALGKIGGPNAEQSILGAAGNGNEKPWVRDIAVQQLGKFKEDVSLAPKLAAIAANDKAYRVRAAALRSIAEIKAPNAYDTLVAAVKLESPDNVLRNAAVDGLGALGDDKAVSLLLDWSSPGKDLRTRQAAMLAVAHLDRKNKDITKALISYLHEPYFDVNFWVLFAIGERGDPDAIAPLQDLLNSGDVSLGERSIVEEQIALLKGRASSK
ncbi:MAG TPA: M1 family aminopeptidase [Candidatus Acidoferrales bacterium]|nr:M1 family aminopeptidase [Candidatus Acidoferrales bacterium]